MNTPKSFDELSRALQSAVSKVAEARQDLAKTETAHKTAQDVYNEAVVKAQALHQELQVHLADLIPGVNTTKRTLHV